MADPVAPATTNTTTDPAAKQRKKEFWNNAIQKGAYGLQRSGSGLGGKAAMMGMPMFTNRGGASGPGQYVDYARDYDQSKMLQDWQEKQRAKYNPPATGGPGPAVDPTAAAAQPQAAPMSAAAPAQAAGTSLADTVTQTRRSGGGGGRSGRGSQSSVRKFF